MYRPPLQPGEIIMGGKAYYDRSLADCMLYPINAARKISLSAAELAYNALHGFYRSSIEHAFGYSKRFRIIVMRKHALTIDDLLIVAVLYDRHRLPWTTQASHSCPQTHHAC